MKNTISTITKILFFFLSIYFLFTYISIGYTQWVLEADLHGFGNSLEYINVVDTTVSWAVGGFFIVKRTNNGWDSLPTYELPPGAYYACIAGLDSLTAWIGSSNGMVHRTTNGGQNWNLQLYTDPGGFINDIKFARVNKNYGYIFSSICRMDYLCGPYSG